MSLPLPLRLKTNGWAETKLPIRPGRGGDGGGGGMVDDSNVSTGGGDGDNMLSTVRTPTSTNRPTHPASAWVWIR